VFSKSLFLSTVAVSVAFAATPAIGIVTASGHFTIERSQVWGNSSLFDGSNVQTDQASTDLALRNGVKLQLGAKSRAQVFENRLALEGGIGQVNASAPYEIDAAGLKISGERLRVSVSDRIEVVAFTGSARVLSSSGTLLASIPAGRSMNFAMQAGSTGSVTRSGCLLFKDGHFILQDENTQEVAELTGRSLEQNVGNRVEASGRVTGARSAVTVATMVLSVTTISIKSQGGCLSVAAALDAKTEAPAASASNASPTTAPARTAESAPKAAGMSTGAKAAIAAVAIGGGAGAAIALAGKKGSTSP
jgi:hypothetical protein